MPSLLQELSALVGSAFEAAGFEARHGAVQPSARPDLCQFQCNGAMPAAKAVGKPPRQAAEAVVERLRSLPAFAKVELAGPGFINLDLADAWLGQRLRSLAGEPRLGAPAAPAGAVLIDFGGPNVAKPLHVGHLRSAVIGDCLQRLHRFLGAEVLSDIHLGDWGTQMGLLIEGLREEQPGLPYFDPAAKGPFPEQPPLGLADLERLYPALSARAKDDKSLAEKARKATQELQAGRPGYRALWRHFVDLSAASVRADFDWLGIRWDLWLGESDSQASIPAMLKDLESRGVTRLSEGAVVIPLDPIGNAETPPLLLVKGDGGYLYGTTDLAAIKERVEARPTRRLLYVADKRQSLHFAQVFQGAAKAAYLKGAHPEHVAFGTVNGKDGKPFKTREGGVMRLGTLLEEARAQAAKRLQESGLGAELPEAEREAVARQVAAAAVKFADLSNHRLSDYAFDLERFTLFEGRTGPYLLYAAVRMKSILRKAAERGYAPGDLPDPGEAERALVLRLLSLPEALERAQAESLPHVLCEWAYELAGCFSTFYQSGSILHEADPQRRAGWLALTQATLAALERVLDLLGISTPEKM